MIRISADWLDDPRTQTLMALVKEAGGQALAVGGCVRNTILSEPVGDIDIATDLLPETIVKIAENAGHKAIPTGIAFGTVTVVIDGEPFEVTTFRRDVETDGRRAVVAFSRDLVEDAARRDFTMNALYVRADGTVIDPVGGLEDAQARRLRFVGQAEERIREDFLRSLRFFRFFAWYARDEDGFDAEAIAAIAANTEGLERLSAERIGHEVRRLLAAPDPVFAAAGMARTGVFLRVLPGADAALLGPLVHIEIETRTQPRWERRLVALGGQDPENNLRLSRREAQTLRDIRTSLEDGLSPAESAYRFGPGVALDSLLVSSSIAGALPEDFEGAIALGAGAVFPVSARDLPETLKGREIGDTLKSLESRWIASGFQLTRDELLS